jgi:hypothetical protein
MSQPCENLAKCGFFINFKGNSEAIQHGWIRLYCEDINKSEVCERKKYKKLHGLPPADNMSPTGKMLIE